MRVLRAASACLLFAGCVAPPEGLGPTPAGEGARVIFDLDQRPLPDIPFPIDLATRPDSASPTGRRVNASLIGSTKLETLFRQRLDRLDGFSTFAAISVSFDAPLDVGELLRRHGPVDSTPDDDAVFVVDLADGRAVPLDVCAGAYPLVLEDPARYFPADHRAGESNLVFETVEEDSNGNGLLDAGEDSDADSVLDHPNTFPVDGDPIDDLLTCYERETNTLLLRPLVPLEPAHTYAVVLTRRLLDESGQPVRSPFPCIHHLQQHDALKSLPRVLSSLGGGLELADVAFAWTFTTQSVYRELLDLRDGLYGLGPFAWLAEAFPPETRLEPAHDRPEQAVPNAFVARASDILDALRPIAGAWLGDPEVVEALAESFRYVDFLVLGRGKTPLLLQGLEGVFETDAARGLATVTEQDLPWLLALPKERPELGLTRPFPVAIYLHGTGGDRMQSLGFAGQLAKFGIATLGVDLVLHGMVLPDDWQALFRSALGSKGFEAVADALLNGRAIDINNDGLADPAGNFWTYDAFRSRDAIRQGAIDVMQLVRIFSAFDGRRTWRLDADGDGQPELTGLAGDFDGDGRVDAGGPENPFFLFGISLGGIVTSVVAPIEPRIVAAVPVSAGGGLTDIVVRSLQPGVPEMAMLPFMGPLLIAAADPLNGRPVLAFYVNDTRFEETVPVHSLEKLEEGWTVRLTNLESGEESFDRVRVGNSFRLAVPCDRGDRLLVEALDQEGRSRWRIDTFDREVVWQSQSFAAHSPLVALAEGFGVRRQSPEMRRFVQLAQTALDAGDPINYVPLAFLRPASSRAQPQPVTTRLSLLLTAGDMHVPISTGISEARAAGLVPFGLESQDERYGKSPMQLLIDLWVPEGLERLRRFAGPPWNDTREVLLDADNLSGGADGRDVPRLDPPLRLRTPLAGGAEAVLRILYTSSRGAHGFGPSDPSKPFNIDLWAINAIGRYFATSGREWSDDPCLADDSCPYIPRLP